MRKHISYFAAANRNPGKIRFVLQEIIRRWPQYYEDLFIYNRGCARKDGMLNDIEKLDFVKRSNGHIKSEVMVRYLDSMFITCDWPTLRDYTRVFPLFDDESVFLAKRLNVRRGDTVLDLGTGSGILAIYAARIADKVYATDINARALEYAKFNSYLNCLQGKISFLRGDVYSRVNNIKFDLIISNPPFVPIPRGQHLFAHSDGGEFGLKISRKILHGIPRYLKPSGRFQMLTMSPGDIDSPVVLEDIRNYFSHLRASIKVTYLYESPVEISKFTRCFKAYWDTMNWEYRFRLNGMDYLHYLLVESEPANHFSLDVAKERIVFSETYYSGGWESRFRRYMIAN